VHVCDIFTKCHKKNVKDQFVSCGGYTRMEHKACIEALPNQVRVNRVFEHTGVPYRPRLELGSEVSEEAARKKKQNAGVGSLTKCAKVSVQKAIPAKTMVAKATESRLAPGVKTMPEAGVVLKVVALSATSVCQKLPRP
jgi:hypothetical protein